LKLGRNEIVAAYIPGASPNPVLYRDC